MKDFGTSESPKSTRSSTTHWCPGRPGIACLRAWTDAAFCRERLGLPRSFQAIPEERLNVDGGAISIGHPVGASGARIVLHLLRVLARNRARLGMASLCIGGSQGGAMLVEVSHES